MLFDWDVSTPCKDDEECTGKNVKCAPYRTNGGTSISKRCECLPDSRYVYYKGSCKLDLEILPYRYIVFAVVGGLLILVLIILIIRKLYRLYKEYQDRNELREKMARIEEGRFHGGANAIVSNPLYDGTITAQSKDLLPEENNHTGGNNDDDKFEDYRHSCLEHTPLIDKKNLSKYVRIGTGNFGVVYKAQLKIRVRMENGEEISQNETVAVKKLKTEATEKAKRAFWKEAFIASDCDHPNILPLRYICLGEKEELPEMVFEYMNLGDLKRLLVNSSGRFRPIPSLPILSLDDLLRIASQIAAGMEYLTKQKYVHGDLASRNCLVGVPPISSTFVVKICDFGLSKDVYRDSYYRVSSRDAYLPMAWMSPESIMNSKFTLHSDVWAYGVTLWEIYTFGEQPYSKYSAERIQLKILDRNLLEIPKKCPREVAIMMMDCWKIDVEKRIEFSEICKRFSHLLKNDIPERVPANGYA